MKEYQQVNKKYAMVAVIIFIIVCIVMVLDTIIRKREGDRNNLNIDFAGRVERVEYDIKEFPTVTLRGGTYYIGSGYNTNNQIEVGDSLTKRKGSDVYILIKHNSHKTIKLTK